MKRTLIVSLISVLVLGTAVAQEKAPFLVGGGLGVVAQRQHQSLDFDQDVGSLVAWETHLTLPLLARVFGTVEMPFLTVEGGVAFQATAFDVPQAYISGSGVSTQLPVVEGLVQADLTALFRLDLPPGPNGTMSLLAGGRYELNLAAKAKSDMNSDGKDNLNNFWVLGGLSSKSDIADNLAFRWGLTAGYDLAKPKNSTVIAGYTKTNDEYLGIAFEASLALLYRL